MIICNARRELKMALGFARFQRLAVHQAISARITMFAAHKMAKKPALIQASVRMRTTANATPDASPPLNFAIRRALRRRLENAEMKALFAERKECYAAYPAKNVKPI
jgi:predicted ribosome quality control (RQC) complex YloA/Tae2 family protein